MAPNQANVFVMVLDCGRKMGLEPGGDTRTQSWNQGLCPGDEESVFCFQLLASTGEKCVISNIVSG